VFGDFDKYIAVFLTGFAVVYLLTPLVRYLARRHGVIDMPNERRPHKQPTARGGGVAIVIGVNVACLVALSFPWPDMAGDFNLHWWRRFVAASLVLLVVGVIDDVRGMKPLIKLGGQATAALLMTYGGTQFGQFFGMQLPLWLDHILVVVWILAVINAFNLIDGLDGLASGLACISAVGLCGIFIIGRLPGNVLVLMGLIGACLAFLRYNLHPASIFLGDTGSMFLGFMLGTISLDTCTKNTFLLSLTIPMLVLGVPIYDTILAIWRRSVRRMWIQDDASGTSRKRGIMQPDLDHLHHRLLKSGLSTRRVAIVLCVGNAALVLFGLMVTTFESHAAGIFLIALLAGVYVLMRHLAIIELRDTGAALLRGLRRPTPITFKALGYPAWDMLAMAAAVAVAKLLSDDYTPNFWYDWFLSLPVWLTPTFALLAVSRTYITIWSRARMRDVLTLVLTLQAGLLFSLGLALLIDPYSEIQKCLLYTLVIFAIGHPAIVFLRVAYRLMEELVSWSRSKEQSRPDEERILLYGSGARCWLLLRELAFSKSESVHHRTIVGLVDDDESLHFRWVYGYLVLGGGKDLPRLIAAHKITGIIVAADLAAKSRESVCDLALEGGLEISEWVSGEQIIVPKPTVARPLPELQPKPVS
jgi:UDP-N-acetylmuramyl pentapeptide phosphotransferase/UDP-N-acetylglucosamine-1-phosphate transferase